MARRRQANRLAWRRSLRHSISRLTPRQPATTALTAKPQTKLPQPWGYVARSTRSGCVSIPPRYKTRTKWGRHRRSPTLVRAQRGSAPWSRARQTQPRRLRSPLVVTNRPSLSLRRPSTFSRRTSRLMPMTNALKSTSRLSRCGAICRLGRESTLAVPSNAWASESRAASRASRLWSQVDRVHRRSSIGQLRDGRRNLKSHVEPDWFPSTCLGSDLRE